MSHLGAKINPPGKMLGHVANFAILSALVPSIAFPDIRKGLHYLKKKDSEWWDAWIIAAIGTDPAEKSNPLKSTDVLITIQPDAYFQITNSVWYIFAPTGDTVQ